MSTVWKRKGAKRYTIGFKGADGRQHQAPGFSDKKRSKDLADALEAEARLVREGLADPHERARRAEGQRPVKDHVEDYRLGLLAKGDTPDHALKLTNAVRRVLADAAIESVGDIVPSRVQDALGRLKARRSARTCNYALRGIRSFATWLEENNRIKEVPRGLASIKPYNEEADRKLVRRALTLDELARLLEATEVAETIVASKPGRGRLPDAWITGPERAVLYRIAMGTGFRAKELRSLTPESFGLDGDSPTITVPAAYTKNGKHASQPITRELAGTLKPWIADKAPGRPVVAIPAKTGRMIKMDLARAGIKPVDDSGRVVDFHALRHSYITHLAAKGTQPKVLQLLARHSDIRLTLGRYTHVEDGDLRGALEKGDEE